MIGFTLRELVPLMTPGEREELELLSAEWERWKSNVRERQRLDHEVTAVEPRLDPNLRSSLDPRLFDGFEDPKSKKGDR
jgi:hypothetical protein